jgi:LuxR family maltose regulon positive regulatory protein
VITLARAARDRGSVSGPSPALAESDVPSSAPLQAAGRLWTAKLTVPPLPAQYVERPRLRAQLDAAASKPVVVLSAPPGAGKTVAASAWVMDGHPPGPTVWLSLDGRDLAAGALWPLLVAGLRRQGMDCPQPAPLAARDTAFLASLASRVAAFPRRLVLVLDCDGALSEEDALGLDYIISHAEQRLGLVVLSRTDPILPLHRYRLRGELAEIRMSDLAFSADEAGELLLRRNVRLEQGTFAVVMRKTQGWAAGIAMLAMDLESCVDVEVVARGFTGDGGTVADYLVAEVLDKQSPEIRSLLLDTSIVDVLLPGLVERLAGRQGLRALAELEHRNAFLSKVPGPATGFRYHPLFRDLLRAVLAYESPERALDLHRTAARWLADQGMLDSAIRHALAARAWEDVAELVVDALAVGQVVVERPNGGLRRLLSSLPPDATGASAALVRAACAMSPPPSEPADLDEQLAAARTDVGRLRGPRRAAADLALSVVTLTAAAAVPDDARVLETAAALDGQLAYADPDRVDDHPELRALLGSARGAALVRAGDLEAAKDAYARGSAAGVRVGCEAPLVECLGQLGLIAAWRGELRAAADWARDGRRAGASRRAGSSPSAAADVTMAWICAERCDVAGARRWLLSAASAPTPPAGPLALSMLTLVRVRICRAQGDIDRALELLEDALVPGSQLPGWLTTRLRLEHARLHMGRGQAGTAFNEAAALVRSGEALARIVRVEAALASGARPARPPTLAVPRDAPLDVRVEACLLESWWRLSQGDEARAVEAAQQSLRLAAREKLRRPFKEGPPEVWRLLRRHGELTAQHHWLSGKPLSPARPQAPRSTPVAPDGRNLDLILKPLTPKEQEVLGHLSELLTTEEIASAMFVSANTVRTHVRNILRKLAASRRNEAVRRARELHLLTG